MVYSRQVCDHVADGLGGKRLVDELGAFRAEALDAGIAALGRDDDDWQVRPGGVRPHLLDHLLAAHDGHVDVHKGHVDPVRGEHFKALPPVGGLEGLADGQPGRTQRLDNHGSHDGTVVHDQYIE